MDSWWPMATFKVFLKIPLKLINGKARFLVEIVVFFLSKFLKKKQIRSPKTKNRVPKMFPFSKNGLFFYYISLFLTKVPDLFFPSGSIDWVHWVPWVIDIMTVVI